MTSYRSPAYNYARPANEVALLAWRDRVESYVEELTQHTSDVFEGFDQWHEGRGALQDFYTQSVEQDRLLQRLRKYAQDIRKALYGNKPIAGAPTLTPERVEKLVSALTELSLWMQDEKTIADRQVEIVQDWKQLPLWSARDERKEEK